MFTKIIRNVSVIAKESSKFKLLGHYSPFPHNQSQLGSFSTGKKYKSLDSPKWKAQLKEVEETLKLIHLMTYEAKKKIRIIWRYFNQQPKIQKAALEPIMLPESVLKNTKEHQKFTIKVIEGLNRDLYETLTLMFKTQLKVEGGKSGKKEKKYSKRVKMVPMGMQNKKQLK